MSREDRPISRRDLFRGGFLRQAGAQPRSSPSPAPTPRSPRALLPLLRPPCAVDEQSFLDGCTRCNKCIEVCPPKAIVLAPARFRAAAGTPMIDPTATPCWMCPDTPCVSACEPGVLLPELPKKMGDAMIMEHNCLAHQGTFCSVCVEQCPVPDALRIENNVPVIDQDICTGCGVCHHVCPAPANAVMILPLRERPSRPNL